MLDSVIGDLYGPAIFYGHINAKLEDPSFMMLKRKFVTDISQVYLALFSETFFKSILTTKKYAVIHLSERYVNNNF